MGGPYLVLVVAGQYPEAHGYAPLRAYAQPIFSGHRFMPVASEFERSVLRELLKARGALDRDGVDLVIEKPVFDRLTITGLHRPDFILEAHSRVTGEIRQIAIDTGGATDGQDQAASTGFGSRAERLPPRIGVSPADLEQGQIISLVLRALDL